MMMFTNAAALCFLTALWASPSVTTAFAPIYVAQKTRPSTGLYAESSKDTDNDSEENHLTRRSLLTALGTAGALSLSPDSATASTAAATGLLADLPMVRLRLPQQAVGRDYIAVQLKIKGQGPFDFMVDSGLTTELITPHLQQSLGIGVGRKSPTVKGLGAGGSTGGGALVQLTDVSLCCGKGGQELPLPQLDAIVTDFPQEHIDPTHDPVEGMLGMELLDLFDVDFDFAKGRLRFWEPGTAAAAAEKDGLVPIPAAELNESLLLGIRVTSPSAPVAQPVVGILDCGSSNTLINWKAAQLLGLSTDANSYRNEPAMMGLGIDGRPQPMPTTMVQLTYSGKAKQTADGGVVFESPPSNWKPWDPVRVGLGNLPVFSELLGDGRNPYKGPAVLIGLDVLSQRRFILETGKTRARRVFVNPK